MPEIPESLTTTVKVKDLKFTAGSKDDTIRITAKLSDLEAATMAWITNHSSGTKLILGIALDKQGPPSK